MGQHGARRCDRQAGGRCIIWWTRRGAPYAREAIGGPVSGYAPVALAVWVRAPAGRHPRRRRPDRPHATSCSTTSPTSPGRRAGTSSRSTTCRCVSPASRPRPRVDDRVRGSPTTASSTELEYDADLVRLAGVDRAKLPPLAPTGIGRWASSPRTSPPISACRPACRWSPACPTCTRPPSGRGVVGTTGAPRDQHHVVDQLPGAVQEDRHPPADRHASRASTRRLPRGQQPRDGRRVPAVAPRPGRRPDDGLARDGPSASTTLTALAATSPAGSGRRHLHAVARGRARAGRRPPRPRRVPQPVARTHPGRPRARGARGRRLQQPLAARAGGEVRQAASRPHPRSSAAAPESDLWCQIHADVLDRTIERVADPVNANLRGAAILAGPRARRGASPTRCATWWRSTRRSAPTRRNRDAYDRLYAEFPQAVQGQKAMFRRLNRRWT